MAKLTRVTGKVFGSTATSTGTDPEIGQFGSAKAGTYVGTGDIAQIQNLTAWNNGWIDAVTPTQQFPTLPEMTGVHKVLSHQSSYILQQGIPEWDSGTTYYQYGFCSKLGKIYISQTNDNSNNDPAQDTTNWNEFTSGGGMPIGVIYSVTCTPDYVPNGALPCDGAEYSKTQFNDLWTNYLTASTPLLKTCTYAEYATAISTYGSCPMFAVDTTNLKFKVPTIKDGAYITQAKSDSELGKSYNESLPNITGSWKAARNGINSQQATSGAFSINSWISGAGSAADSGHNSPIISFNASDSSSTYQDNAKVQGDNVRLRYFVQVATGQINQSQMDWTAWASSLQGKINLDGTNISSAGTNLKTAITDYGMPDYTAGTSFSSGSTTQCDGVIVWYQTVGTKVWSISINGVMLYKGDAEYSNMHAGWFNIGKNNVVTYTQYTGTVTFYPLKGVN